MRVVRIALAQDGLCRLYHQAMGAIGISADPARAGAERCWKARGRRGPQKRRQYGACHAGSEPVGHRLKRCRFRIARCMRARISASESLRERTAHDTGNTQRPDNGGCKPALNALSAPVDRKQQHTQGPDLESYLPLTARPQRGRPLALTRSQMRIPNCPHRPLCARNS